MCVVSGGCGRALCVCVCVCVCGGGRGEVGGVLAFVVSNSFHLTCVIFGDYLRLAEVLVGKTRVPSVKTTAKGVKGFAPLRSGGGPPTVTLTVLDCLLRVLCS